MQKSKRKALFPPESASGATWTHPGNRLSAQPWHSDSTRPTGRLSLLSVLCPALSLPGFSSPREKNGHSDPASVTRM